MRRDSTGRFIRWFNTISLKDTPLVGGKNASLGELYQELVKQGIRVPNGYAITANSYWYLLKENGILDQLDALLSSLDTENIDDLRTKGQQARHLIVGAEFPTDLKQEI